jgi:hypothetical protein
MGLLDYIPNVGAQAVNVVKNGRIFGQDTPGVKNFLVGGNATKDMQTQPQTADFQRGYLMDMLGRSAPTMDAGQSNQTRGQQNQLASMLTGIAQGNRAGAGEMAVNRQVGQAQAAQTAGASMARGANAALANRQAARMSADIGVNGAGQAAIAQTNDQTNAVGQLGGLLSGMRQQDIGVAQGNQQAQMQQQNLQISALAQMLGVDEAALRQDLAKRGLQMQDKGILPGLLQTGGQIGAAAAGGGI